jgi:hypothetical protein
MMNRLLQACVCLVKLLTVSLLLVACSVWYFLVKRLFFATDISTTSESMQSFISPRKEQRKKADRQPTTTDASFLVDVRKVSALCTLSTKCYIRREL